MYISCYYWPWKIEKVYFKKVYFIVPKQLKHKNYHPDTFCLSYITSLRIFPTVGHQLSVNKELIRIGFLQRAFFILFLSCCPFMLLYYPERASKCHFIALQPGLLHLGRTKIYLPPPFFHCYQLCIRTWCVSAA